MERGHFCDPLRIIESWAQITSLSLSRFFLSLFLSLYIYRYYYDYIYIFLSLALSLSLRVYVDISINTYFRNSLIVLIDIHTVRLKQQSNNPGNGQNPNYLSTP